MLFIKLSRFNLSLMEHFYLKILILEAIAFYFNLDLY